MPATQNATTPTSETDVTALLSQVVPVGGDNRLIAGVTGVLQKLLNLASIASRLVLGGQVGDSSAIGNIVSWWADQYFRGDVTVIGGLFADGTLQANSGRVVVGKSATLAASGALTLSPLTARFYWMPTQSGGAQNATINDSGCADDDEFEVLLGIGANSNLSIYAPDGTTLLMILYGAQTAHSRFCRFRRKAGTWHAIQGVTNGDLFDGGAS